MEENQEEVGGELVPQPQPQQPIPADYSDSFYGMPPMKRDSSLEIGLIREINPKKIMDDIEHYLTGEIFDLETGKYIRKFKPIMNKEGINTFLFIANGVINQIVTLSNFEDDEIRKLAVYIMERAIPVISLNWKEYGVVDKTLLPTIHSMIFTMVWAALKKSLKEGERRMIGRTIQENIMSRQIPYENYQEKRGGIFSRLNPFGRR